MASSKVERLRAQLNRVKEERQDQIEKATTLALVGAGAFAAGYIPAEFPDIAEVGGIRIELLAGGTLVALGLMDVLDDYSDEAVALGAGMLAADFARRGRELGAPD